MPVVSKYIVRLGSGDAYTLRQIVLVKNIIGEKNGEPKTRWAKRADEVKMKAYMVLDNSAKSLQASQKKFVYELRRSKFIHTFNQCERGLERSIDTNFLSNLKVYFETKSRTSYSRGLNIFGRQSMGQLYVVLVGALTEFWDRAGPKGNTVRGDGGRRQDMLKISVLYTRLSLSFTVVFSLTIYILLLSLLDQLYSPTIDTSVPQSFHIRCARLRYVYLTVFDLYLTHTHS